MTDHPTLITPRMALVIEDEPAVRSLLVTMLSELDCAVLASDGGAQLRERLDVLRPDIIFLDIGLPGSDVGEILTFLVDYRYTGSIQIVSGQPVDVVAAVVKLGESLDLRMLDPIAKPFRMAVLETLLADLPAAVATERRSEIEQRAWLKAFGDHTGLIDLRVHPLRRPADQLDWWLAHGPRYSSALLGFPATSSFTVETAIADVPALTAAMSGFAPGAFLTMPTIVLDEDDIFSDVAAARTILEAARRAGFVIRMTGCGTRFFAMAGHAPLAVDQAEIGSFLGSGQQDNVRRLSRLADIAHRAGTILLAETRENVSDEGSQPLGLDLSRARSTPWMPIIHQAPPMVLPIWPSRNEWRPVSVRDALALRKAC
jgi:CheY-like chemotaxis protein